MSQTNIFKSNRTQAIRLPKAVAFPDDVKRVEIVKQGNNRLIVPVAQSTWKEFFSKPGIDDDFLDDRQQPPMQERNWD
jgi:antitoxin VapB